MYLLVLVDLFIYQGVTSVIFRVLTGFGSHKEARPMVGVSPNVGFLIRGGEVKYPCIAILINIRSIPHQSVRHLILGSARHFLTDRQRWREDRRSEKEAKKESCGQIISA